MSRSRLLSKLAKDIDDDGNITQTGLADGVGGGGVTVYATRSSLPSSGNTAGDQAFVTDNSRLYIWNGSGWYNVALLNLAPSITSVADSDGITTPFTLSAEGTVTTITITATDSDGDPLTYESSADSDFSGIATLSQSSNVFTITPLSEDSATTTSGTITFTATDGVNTASSGVQTFTLNFVSPLWKNVVHSIGHSDGQGATTAAVADRSGNGYAIGINSASGYPAQGSFHPYLDNWGVFFDGSDDALIIADDANLEYSNNDFCVEGWICPTSDNYSSNHGCIFTKSSSGVYAPLNIYTDGSTICVYMSSTGSSFDIVNGSDIGSVNLGQWHHFAVVRSGSTISGYVDGTRGWTITTSATLTNNNRGFGIGARATTYDQDYTGFISNLRYVLGSAVYDPSQTSITVPTSKLTAITNTKLLLCQSNRFVDNSGNNYTITTNSTPKISAFNPFGQGSEYERNNRYGSLWFGDADNNASIQVTDGTVTDFGTDDFTIEFWFYPSGTIATSTYTIVNGFNNPGTSGTAEFHIQTSGNNKRLQWNAFVSAWQTLAYSDTNWSPYAWTHAAFVRNGTSCKIYQNGVEVASASVSSNQSFNNDFSYTRIGCNAANTSEFRGYLADFRITKGTAVYTSAFTAPADKVGAGSSEVWLPMDNGYIYDKAGNSNILNNSSTVDNTYSKFGSFAYKGARFNLPIGIEADKWTLEFWWRGTGAGDYFNLYNSAGTIKMRLLMQVDYGTNYKYRIGFTGGVSNKSGGQFADGWNHVALVKNGGTTVYLYENGAYKGSQSYGSEDITSSGGYIIFGSNHWYENIQFLVGTAKYTGTGSGTFTAPTVEQGYGTQTTGTAS